jgi:hypothetical protein
MGYNGSGGYNRLHNWVNDKNGSIKITASRMDAEFDDFASAMEFCLLKDGQQNPTANLPMATFKHTGVGAASARNQYIDGATLQDGGFIWAGLASGTSAIALTMNPTITTYTTGMRVGFIAVGDNASAVTINIDGVSAAAGVKGKNEALVATDIVSGGAYWITYKGADGWQFGNPLEENPTFVTLMTTGLATLGNVLCSGSAVFTSSLNVTGPVTLAGNTYPTSAGSAKEVLEGDGAGGVIWASRPSVIQSQIVANSLDVETGTGLALIHIPWSRTLQTVHAEVAVAGTGSVLNTIDINKNGTSMLSTKLTIDSTETGSDTAATAAVIDGAQDDVVVNDVITIDVDAVSTAAATGLTVTMVFI